MSDADTPTVQVFTAEDCGRCPTVIELVSELTTDRSIAVEVLDVEEDRRVALRAGVLSVPTVVVGDEQFRGVPDRERLETAIAAAEST